MLPRRTARRTGAALIITLGVLLVLAVLAISFSRFMIPERDAARQTSLSVQARMAAVAGIERADACLYSDLRTGTFLSLTAPWRYFGEDRNRNGRDDPGEDLDLNGVVQRAECPIGIAKAPSYQFGAGLDYSGVVSNPGLPKGHEVRYKLRIVDAESLINLNNNYPGFDRLLDNFGDILKGYLGMSRDVIKSISYGGKTGGQAIVLYRNSLLGQKFSMKRQILPLLQRGEEDYKVLENYITVHSWEIADAYIERGVQGNPDYWWTLNGWRWWDPANPASYRCQPININTASKPVLAAALTDIVGYYPHATTWGSHYDGSRLKMPADYKFYLYKVTTPRATALALADIFVSYRNGTEVDTNRDGWPDAGEDGNGNGIIDKGPFKSWQEVDHLLEMILTYPSPTVAAINPNAQLMRYNPEYMPTAWTFAEDDPPGSGQKAWAMWDDTRLSDKGYIGKHPPMMTVYSHGQFEIHSQGMVLNDRSEIIASKVICTVLQIYHSIRHSSQKDFLSKPDTGAPWMSDQTPPTVPWTSADYAANIVNTATVPENIIDNTAGSSTPQPTKADPLYGAVQLERQANVSSQLRFRTDFRPAHNAEVAIGGGAATAGSSSDPYAPNRKNDNTTIHGPWAAASDLFPEGTFGQYSYGFNRGRNRSISYPSRNNLSPFAGSSELWWKADSLISAGDILTAWHPSAPTLETFSTEGIEYRIFLGYVPFRPTFGGLIPTDRPYRWWSHGLFTAPGVWCVPCICAERRYYTAAIGNTDGVIYGRDTGFGAYPVSNFVDIEYFPILNDGRDGFWHHLYVSWTSGTDLQFFMDGRRAPYSYTRTVAQWSLKSNLVASYWTWDRIQEEMFIGGYTKKEWLDAGGNLTWSGNFGYSGKPMEEVDHIDDMWWGDGPAGSDWHNDSTVDFVRIYDGVQAMNLNRFPSTGGYRNTIQLPQDAKSIVLFAWNEYLPTWDPRIDGGNTHYGSYLFPNERPQIDMTLVVSGSPSALTPGDGSGSQLNITVAGGDVVEYRAMFSNPGALNPLQVTPILEDVMLGYSTGRHDVLSWEEY